MRIIVEGADIARVREVAEAALDSIGVGIAAEPSERMKHDAELTVRRSAGGDRVHLSLRFRPPIHAASCAKVLARIGEAVGVVRVGWKEHRTVLPGHP